ncbi:MAG: hypothetical protein PHT69_03865 [Bacteroidales bacterium]|nr:hypothetical protein [Bacteroidales bacterium]
MHRSLLIISFFFLVLSDFYGQEILLKGKYQGKNLYVINPSIVNDTTKFCVKAVYVNRVQTMDEINSNAFEIDFSLINIAEGADIEVLIVHEVDCLPEIINPNVIEISANFSISTPRIDRRTSLLNWTVTGTVDENPFIVEQFRFNKWIVLSEVEPIIDTAQVNTYTYAVSFHSKQNTFRIRHVDKSGIERTSRECRFFARADEITLLSTRVSEWIYFSAETFYELYDENGFFILDGFGKDIDVRELGRGRYYLNFDNRTEQITKR